MSGEYRRTDLPSSSTIGNGGEENSEANSEALNDARADLEEALSEFVASAKHFMDKGGSAVEFQTMLQAAMMKTME